MSENTDLPPLSLWSARSTWVLIGTAAVNAASLLGFDLLNHLGLPTVEAFADKLMPLVTLGAMVWVWLERRSPHYRLTTPAKAVPTHPDAG